jgi:hypothetical protein
MGVGESGGERVTQVDIDEAPRLGCRARTVADAIAKSGACLHAATLVSS